jgi:hypothetical protein
MTDKCAPLVKNTFLHFDQAFDSECALMRQHTAPAQCFERQISSTRLGTPRRVSFVADDICQGAKSLDDTSSLDEPCLKEPEAEPTGSSTTEELDNSKIEELCRQVSELSVGAFGRQISSREDLDQFCRQLSAGISSGGLYRQETEQAWPTWTPPAKAELPAEQETEEDSAAAQTVWNPQVVWNPMVMPMQPWSFLPFAGGGLAGSVLNTEAPQKRASKRKGKSLITLAHEAQLRKQQEVQPPEQTVPKQQQAKQSQKKESAGEGAKFCPFCGKAIQANFKFCRFCGGKVEAVFKTK